MNQAQRNEHDPSDKPGEAGAGHPWYTRRPAVIAAAVLVLLTGYGILDGGGAEDEPVAAEADTGDRDEEDAGPEPESNAGPEAESQEDTEADPGSQERPDPEPDPVAVPDVVGLGEAAAVEELESAGFEVRSRSGISDDEDPGLVYRSDPVPGVEADEGSRVTVFVVREEPEPEPEPEVAVVGLGDTVEYNDWSFHVRDVQVLTSIDRADPPRGRYVVAMVEATNEGSAPRSFAGSFRIRPYLYDPVGEREYEFDSSASLSHHHAYRDDTWHLEDIGPGFTAVMPIVFDVPEDVEVGMFVLAGRDDLSDAVTLEFD